MTIELWMLVGVTIVYIVAILAQSMSLIFTVGHHAAAGNREEMQYPLPGLAGRTQRLVANHVEGLAMFTPLVLIAATAGLSTPMTVLGSQIYLGARIGHALCYIFGIVWLRTLAFVLGIVGLVMLLIAIMSL